MFSPRSPDRAQEAGDVGVSLKSVHESLQLRGTSPGIDRTRRRRTEGFQRGGRLRLNRGDPAVREHRDQQPGDLLVVWVVVRVDEFDGVARDQPRPIRTLHQSVELRFQRAAAGRRSRDPGGYVAQHVFHGIQSPTEALLVGIRVLVVEDQPKILKAQIKLLQTFDEIEIVGEALSGESALEMLDAVRPEVILLDLGLPQMSGIEVTRSVRQSHKDIEILIFTIFDEEEKVTEAIVAGAAGYLLKGTPVEKIVEAIKDVHAGGAVIQPNLARSLLRLIGRAAPFTRPQGENTSVLTDRELEILQIIAKGLSNNEAAKVVGLSKATIRTHLEHIYEKLDVTNRVEAVTEGIRQGIINL